MEFKIFSKKDEEGRFVAECLEITGRIYRGKTLYGAPEGIKEAIEERARSRIDAVLEEVGWLDL